MKLNRAYIFQKQCIESDQILRNEHVKADKVDIEFADDDSQKLDYENGITFIELKEDQHDDKTEDFIKSEIEYLDNYNYETISFNDEQFESGDKVYKEEHLDIKSEESDEKGSENLDYEVEEYLIEPESTSVESYLVNQDEIIESQNTDVIFKKENFSEIAREIESMENPNAEDIKEIVKKFRAKKSSIPSKNKTSTEIKGLCPHCGKILKSHSQYFTHMWKYHRNEEDIKKYEERHGSLTCTMCEKKFSDKYTLRKHILTHNNTPPTFPCDICGKLFKKQSIVLKHLKTHSDIKPFKCNICNEAKLTQNELNIHMRFHTGERPYKCSICEKAFITASHRKSHERTHSDQRLQCDVCGKDFKTSNVLRNHVRTHNPDKYLSCLLCDEKFATAKRRKSHLKNAHPEFKPLECKVCHKKFDKQAMHDRHYRVNHLKD